MLPLNVLSLDMCINNEVNSLCSEYLFQILSETITASTIAEATIIDSMLDTLLKRLKNDCYDEPYTVSHNILFYKNLIYIPSVL